MYADEDVEERLALRIRPGESDRDFAARVAQAHGPLTQAEIAKLRKIFAPQTATAAPAPAGTAA